MVSPEKGTGPLLGRAQRAAMLACLVVSVLTVPLLIRVANAERGAKAPASTYLPALESPWERAPFDPDPVGDLARLKPGFVVIGDSMAGRIDVRRLGDLTGRPVAPLVQAASGSAYWYLALKNWVVASGIKPRLIFVFFSDTNLTDVLFRLNTWSLDRVAQRTRGRVESSGRHADPHAGAPPRKGRRARLSGRRRPAMG
jgi:hypothetical protein